MKEAVTNVIDTLTQDDFHGAFQKLCVVSIKVPIRKKSGNLFNDPRIYIYSLIASAEEHKIDIICIQEHRYTHTEDIKYHETGNRWSLATVSAWKNSVNAAVGG